MRMKEKKRPSQETQKHTRQNSNRQLLTEGNAVLQQRASMAARSRRHTKRDTEHTPSLRTRQDVVPHPLSPSVLEVSPVRHGDGKKQKTQRSPRTEEKLQSHTTTYVRKYLQRTYKVLKLVNKFSKVTVCKIIQDNELHFYQQKSSRREFFKRSLLTAQTGNPARTRPLQTPPLHFERGTTRVACKCRRCHHTESPQSSLRIPTTLTNTEQPTS